MKKLDYKHFDSLNAIDSINDTFDSTFTFNQKYKNIQKFI